VFSILLYLFVCDSEDTYASLPPVATFYIFQKLPQYKMKSTVDTYLLNMLHSHQQNRAAIVSHVTQRNISIQFVLPATGGHTATNQTKLRVHIDCL